MVNVGSIPTGPTHGEGRLQPHPGDVLKSTPNVRKNPRSGLDLEGRLSDTKICFQRIRSPGVESGGVDFATFDVGRDDGLGSWRNLLGVKTCLLLSSH